MWNEPVPSSLPLLHAGAWRERRERRRALALHALVDGRAAAALLGRWPWAVRPAAVAAVMTRLRVEEGEQTRALGALVVGDGPDLDPARAVAEVERDRVALAWRPPDALRDEDLRLGGLYLLARLGEELAARHGCARSSADPRDAAIASLWRQMLGAAPDPRAGERLRVAFGARIARAFEAVCLSLGLPEVVARARGEEALEASDALAWAVPAELAARVLEGAGDPVLWLSTALGPEERARVHACVARRTAWHEAAQILGTEPSVAEGASLALALRVLAALGAGCAPEHALGLPCWGLVTRGQARMRGRLRAVLRARPEALRDHLLALDGLYERTATAVSRYAWDWAWREARVGFGFDLNRLSPPACAPDPPDQTPMPPLESADDPALLTWLLTMVGRGCWTELNQWLTGEGRGLSSTFYRHLRAAPQTLADPETGWQRARTYTRLREHLQDGGLEAWMPRLRAVAARAAAVPPDRNQRAALHRALLPDWDSSAVPLPEHGTGAFCAALAALLEPASGEDA